jgi:hypothetical protein
LLESIHSTSDPATKVALIPKDNVENVRLQLAALHSILLQHVLPEYQEKVFVPNHQAGLTTQQVDSRQAKVQQCPLSLLQCFNPQNGEEPDQPPKRSQLAHVLVSYSTDTMEDAFQGHPPAHRYHLNHF